MTTLTKSDTSIERFLGIRKFSEELCETLEPEDCVIQSMPDVSPTRWHLAHTTWFFETFILSKSAEYQPYDSKFTYLFNSYYNAIGDQFPRPQRGLLSRPTVSDIFKYRGFVDEQMERLIADTGADELAPLLPIMEVGLHHEQQHQELMLTDIKHVLSCNPLYPAYRETALGESADIPDLDWIDFEEGLQQIGYDGEGFCFDNESPRHRTYVEPYSLATRPVTNGEYLDFVSDGGYERPELWLSEGWNTVREGGWKSPLYWIAQNGKWWQFTLTGLVPLQLAEPVCHVSYYEADAFARWAGARLPTEAEWEIAAVEMPMEGNFVERRAFHPQPVADPQATDLIQLYGDVWEWTSSQYSPYPGYAPASGALGEYNGKFMCNQFVLRGGSCATSQSHIRPTYRNFFPPSARWQFTGIRLAC